MTRQFSIQRLRNIGIVAHVDAGKTTLTERILYFTGRVHRVGEVHHGNTTTDHLPQERARGITITAAAVTCDFAGHRIELIDTPGHVDFTIEVERSLRVLDGCVVVLDAVAGVEPQTETVWRQADRRSVPRIVFVNKLDRAGADFGRVVRGLEERFGVRTVPVTIPFGEEHQIAGVIDVIERELVSGSQERAPIPESHRASAETARERLVEILAELDERVLDTLGEDLPALKSALRSAALSGAVVPVLAGSAGKSLGVVPLLRAVVDYLPSPLDRGAVAGEGGEIRRPDDEEPLAALSFKVAHTAHGAHSFVRVYSGVLRRGDTALAMRSQRRFRIGRLVRPFADSFEDIEEARAGEIAALVAEIPTGETIAQLDAPVALESIVAPEPVVTVAVHPKTGSDRDRLSLGLSRLCLDDPSLRVRSDPETGETTLSGMGELHLDVSLEHLRSLHGVEARASAPRVAYRETVRAAVEHEHKHAKQSGGPGQFAVVRIRLEPLARGSGSSFESRIRGGAIPEEFVPGVEEGVERAMASGVVGGYPVTDVRVVLLDGAFHSKDSSEYAFAIASERAFSEAMRLAKPALLEPVMRVTASVQEGSVGDVVGDLGSRRGQVLGIESARGSSVVTALVPLSELFGYEGTLRSRTQGRGTSSMVLDGYALVPDAITARVLERS
jgi:elongation factor G